MFGMGWGEIFLILVVSLIVIGPDKIPEVARTLAKAVRQVQRFATDIRDSIDLDELQQSNRSNTGGSNIESLNNSERLADGSQKAKRSSHAHDDDDDEWYEDDDEDDYQMMDSHMEKSKPAAAATPAKVTPQPEAETSAAKSSSKPAAEPTTAPQDKTASS
uniref:Tat translocase protein, TatB subunit n=1 Tax=Magnetococcus massalia (strain MO-1) TaxID=451514 RepID=A0A1S7LJG4_MAGMO|nr:Tat translocase protein, TatB subunit [Candidatus Magnetococcus massalia]